MARPEGPWGKLQGISPEKQKWLREAIQRIVTAFAPDRIILFGSHAWGSPGTGSDIDLLIIMGDGERPARRSARIARLLLDVPFPIDILVRTPAEIEHRLRIGDHFIREILEQGIALYERA